MRKSFHHKASKLEREEKKKQRYMIIMSLFLIFIMVSSLFVYAFFYNPDSSQSNTVEEYGQTFRIVTVDGQQVWEANFGDTKSYFFALPSQVEGYYAQDEALNRFTESEIMSISFNPLELDAQFIPTYLGQFGEVAETKLVSYGLTQPSDAFPNVTTVTCDNATSFAPVISIGITNVSNETGILLVDDCITVKGTNPQDVFFLTEKLRYAHFGIDFTTPVIE